MRPILALLAAFAIMSGTALAQPTNSLPMASQERMATVKILGQESIGSGVLIAPNLILTAKHVISTDHSATEQSVGGEGSDFIIEFGNGLLLKGDIIVVNTLEDLAVIEIKQFLPLELVPARLACSRVGVGDSVVVLGFPLGLPYIFSPGLVSSTDILPGEMKGLIPISAIVNHGNSGGPVFNSDGEVVGILTQMYNTTNSAGPGLMIPVANICKMGTHEQNSNNQRN